MNKTLLPCPLPPHLQERYLRRINRIPSLQQEYWWSKSLHRFSLFVCGVVAISLLKK